MMFFGFVIYFPAIIVKTISGKFSPEKNFTIPGNCFEEISVIVYMLVE